MTEPRFQYRPQDGGHGFIAMHNGERVAVVLEAAPGSWAAWNTNFVPLRGRFSSRRKAALFALRRMQKAEARND